MAIRKKTVWGLWIGLACGPVLAGGMAGMQGMQMGPMPSHLPPQGQPLTWKAVAPLIRDSQTLGVATDGTAGAGTVTFRGRKANIVMIAVQPGFPDQTFEIHGRVDPQIVVHAGAAIRLTLVNMDYGPGMIHGVVIAKLSPPFPEMVSVPPGARLVELPLEMPRTSKSLKRSGYHVERATFMAPMTPGTYAYFCQMPGHAHGGMAGRFVVVR